MSSPIARNYEALVSTIYTKNLLFSSYKLHIHQYILGEFYGGPYHPIPLLEKDQYKMI
jgi:hypothetical protein